MAAPEGLSESALILVIPEAEELVSPYRLLHDSSASVGVPAHVTVLYPFILPQDIGESQLARLAKLFVAQPAFDLRFERTARFPDVLYLEPLPPEPVIALVELVTAAYPDYPPYGGLHPTIIPHLTIAKSGDDELLQALDVEITALGSKSLPIQSHISQVTLYEKRDERWEQRTSFLLRG